MRVPVPDPLQERHISAMTNEDVRNRRTMVMTLLKWDDERLVFMIVFIGLIGSSTLNIIE